MSATRTLSTGISHPSGRHGALRLAFELRGGRTVLTEQYSHAPLRVMRPVGHTSGAALVYLLSPTGGVLQGDRYEVSIRVGAGARALFTTQAATKVYGMDGEGASQTTRIHVEAGGLLEYLPDPLILYAESDYTQEVDITLDAGARLVYQEIVMPGRIARGERLAFRRFSARLTARDAEGVLLHERAVLNRGDRLDALGGLDGFACWGSWYGLGVGAMEDGPWRSCAEDMPTGDSSAIGGITRLPRGGIAARMLAHTSAEIARAFARTARDVYKATLGIEPIELRKY